MAPVINCKPSAINRKRTKMSKKQSYKSAYAECTKVFPRMMQKFRAQPPEVEGCEDSVAFMLENEIHIVEKARYFAGRGNYLGASEILNASCELIKNCTPEGVHCVWANLFYIRQLLAWRGRLKKKHWRRAAKLRIKYFKQALAIINDTDLDWPVVSELHRWHPTVERMFQEAKSYRDYRVTADFVGRLNTALDAVMHSKGADAKALLEVAIASLPVADDDE